MNIIMAAIEDIHVLEWNFVFLFAIQVRYDKSCNIKLEQIHGGWSGIFNL
jgi:hypothetical protein